MRKSHFTEEQIIGVLKEQEAGLAMAELCRKHGISQQTLYRWKAKYGGLEVSEARRLRELEEENRQLKHALAESMLDNGALKAVLSKSSKPAGTTRSGPASHERSRAEPAKSLQADSDVAWNRTLRTQTRAAQRGERAIVPEAARVGGRAKAMGLPAPACTARVRRLAAQHKKGVPDLGRGAVDRAQAAEAAQTWATGTRAGR